MRVQLLSLTHPVCRSEADADDCTEWFSALSVGRAAVSLLADAGVPGQAVVDIDKRHYAHPRTSLMTAAHFSSSTHEVSP